MHLRALGTVQRAALLRIISAFKTMVTQTLEVECHILPLHLRLKRRGQAVVTWLCTLRTECSLPKVMKRVKERVKHKGTKSGSALILTTRLTELDGLDSLKTTDSTPMAPWSQPAFDAVITEQDKVQAVEEVTKAMRSWTRSSLPTPP